MPVPIDRKFISVLALLILLYLTYVILEPMLPAIIWAIILAYLFYPLYLKLDKQLKRKWLSALIITGLIIVIAVVSVTLLFNVLSREVVSTYGLLRETLSADQSA